MTPGDADNTTASSGSEFGVGDAPSVGGRFRPSPGGLTHVKKEAEEGTGISPAPSSQLERGPEDKGRGLVTSPLSSPGKKNREVKEARNRSPPTYGGKGGTFSAEGHLSPFAGRAPLL